MGPINTRRDRRVGFRVTSNQLNAKLIIKVNDTEENQRNNTPLAHEHIRDTLATTPILAKHNEKYIRDAGIKYKAAHTFRSPHFVNQVSQQRRSAKGKENIQPNSLQGVNKSSITQAGKKHINVINRMENFTIGMPQPHNFVNQVDDQNTSMGKIQLLLASQSIQTSLEGLTLTKESR
ncbi:hypothetical protein Cgig2_028763 [Carnegiea gigantea]|uniref:Uncharacterized protein n=1 Tax=Carnegiea gigantea TaxID=171969 RepID=A0A9Q1JQR8_9CARY|nr:hypothetical protein Cgig2_028763 [Carnegiea gigantea]